MAQIDDDGYMDLSDYLDRYANGPKPRKRGKKSTRAKYGGSRGELALLNDMRYAGIPEPQRELVFHSVRKWRFDFAWPDLHLAAEVNGGTWNRGRHNRGSAIAAEYEKLNHAILDGWKVFLFTTDMVTDGTAVQYLINYFEEVNHEIK